MKTGSGLLLIGAGAILAFAVTTNTSVLNLHAAGWVIMLIGLSGLLIPKRGYGWIGRRLFIRRYKTRRGGTAGNITYQPYVTRDPDSARVRASLPAGSPASEYAPGEGETEVIEDIYEE